MSLAKLVSSRTLVAFVRSAALLLLCIGTTHLFAQNVAWIKEAGDLNSNNEAIGVIIDHSHNEIVSGTFEDTANFSGTMLNNYGFTDGFIAKYDSSGNLLWARNFGGTAFDCGGHATVDAYDNIYVSGFFKGSAIYFTSTDSLVKNPAAISNSFIAKYDSNGTFIWATPISSATQVESWAITTTPSGNIVIGGVFNTDITIADTSFANPYYNLYLAEFTSSGSYVWAQLGSSLGLCKVNELSCDAAGNIYAAGKLSSNLTFGTVTGYNIGGDDAWFGKFDSSGNALYLRVLGNSYFVTTTDGGLDAANTIQPDNLGNIYVGGNLLINYSFLSSTQKGFFAKYDDTGGQVWIDTFGNTGESATGIIVDPANNLYVTGLAYAADTIGDSILNFTPGGNTFVGRFDPATGNAVWLKASVSGGTGADLVGYQLTGDIAVDQGTGAVVASGVFLTNLAFDASSVTNTDTLGDPDIFMVRIWNYVAGLATPAIAAPANEVNIYPNPTTSYLNFQLSSGTWHKITMVNKLGETVDEWETNINEFTTNINSFPAGNYFFIVTDNNGIKTTREITKL